jgi:AP2-associated kinase
LESGSSGKKKNRRRSSGKSHRRSIPSISLSGTKNIITGKFSDAFRKFEGGAHRDSDESPPRDDEPLRQHVLTPIAGSEATGTSGRSDDEYPLAETQELPPEVRRELERQQLEREEQRVAAAAAAYKNRVANPTDRMVAQHKGSAIQNRVKELLDSTKEVQVSRTAEGYGRFTEGQRGPAVDRPPVARKPVGMSKPAVANSTGPRPTVAPKPKTLRTGGPMPATPASGQAEEDWEANFQKRYPSLAGLEMVETDIRPTTRVKDV